MTFTFSPKTEKEVSTLFEKGDYRFKVIGSEYKTDKNGNPMLHIKMQVFHNVIPGKTTIVHVYLTNNPNFEFLIRHFAYSIGIGESYEKGKIEPQECNERSGIVRLGISIDKNGQYPDKNNALDFIIDDKIKPNEKAVLNENLNDDIPF